MEGIIVLNVINEISILFLIGSLAIIGAIVSAIIGIIDGCGRTVVYSVLILIIGSFLIYIGVTNPPPERYEVIINDSVSVQELSEKYQIISQRGNIYTIQEKIK